MKLYRLLVGILALLLTVTTVLWADDSQQQEELTTKKVNTSVFEAIRDNQLQNGNKMSFKPPQPPISMGDEKTERMYKEAWQAYYQYLSRGLEHRQQVYRWQFRSSKIIFYTVLLLVFIGIIFSGIQFYKAMRLASGSSESDEAHSESMRSEFEATPGGIKISSPVLGVIILTISLAFFYLYLVYVYPINELF